MILDGSTEWYAFICGINAYVFFVSEKPRYVGWPTLIMCRPKGAAVPDYMENTLNHDVAGNKVGLQPSPLNLEFMNGVWLEAPLDYMTGGKLLCSLLSRCDHSVIVEVV